MNYSTLLFLLTILAIFATPVLAGPMTWKLDPAHTEVRFTWDHLGMSRQGGRFREVTGTLTFDPERLDASAVEVSIPLASISTGVAKLDEHLVTTRDFFDAEAHPEITFESTGVKQKSDRTLDVKGDLTINGVSRPVTLDVIWNFTGDHPLANINPTFAGHYSSGFSATTQIRRSDWGIKRTIPYISDEIRITIETEMHLVGPPPGSAAHRGELEAQDAGAAETGDGAGGESSPAQGLGDETVDKSP